MELTNDLINELDNMYGVNLISLYIPPKENLKNIKSLINSQYFFAQCEKRGGLNARKRGSIGMVATLLRNYDKIPENGLIIFTGIIGVNRFIQYDFISPEKLEFDFAEYYIDKTFYVKLLKDLNY